MRHWSRRNKERLTRIFRVNCEFGDWKINTGVKPYFNQVDVRFDNCTDSDSALEQKWVRNINPNEMDWHLDQGGSEITHYRKSELSY